MITANQPFGEWGRIFPDPAMTLAAVDRLVHHATIFEMNVESYRRRTALDRKRVPADRRPARQSKPLTRDAPRHKPRSKLSCAGRSTRSSSTRRDTGLSSDCRSALIQIVALQEGDRTTAALVVRGQGADRRSLVRGGVSVCSVARRHGIAQGLLFTWRRQARQGRLGGDEQAPVFVPVVITPGAVVGGFVAAVG